MLIEFYDIEGASGTISQGNWDCVPRQGEHVSFHNNRWRVDSVEYGRMRLHAESEHEDPDRPIAYVALVDKEVM